MGSRSVVLFHLWGHFVIRYHTKFEIQFLSMICDEAVSLISLLGSGTYNTKLKLYEQPVKSENADISLGKWHLKKSDRGIRVERCPTPFGPSVKLNRGLTFSTPVAGYLHLTFYFIFNTSTARISWNCACIFKNLITKSSRKYLLMTMKVC